MDKLTESTKSESKNPLWDIVIVGSGPAGLTAAIYATRGAASTLVLAGSRWGGQLMLTTEVDNFPGFPKGIQGPKLMMRMRKQAERFGAKLIEKDVDLVDFSTRPFSLTAGGVTYLAKTVILAIGAETKWLGVESEERLRGRGISSCAPCDAPFFKNKKVVVIGGGDSAMEEALVLSKFASEVIIIHRRDEFRASNVMQKRVLKNPKIKVIWNSEVSKFIGEEKLEAIEVVNHKTGKTDKLEVEGAFVAIGHQPATDFLKGKVELDEKGYVKVYNHTKTSVDGVFVAGDVHDYQYRQAITAAGFGCMAALEALKLLDKD